MSKKKEKPKERRNYVLIAIDECLDRIQKVLAQMKEGKAGKREMNKLEHCVKVLSTTRMLVERDLQPPKPRMLEDGIQWIRSQKKDGTFIALLDKETHLLRTVFITPDVLTDVPEYEVTTTPVELTMQKIQLTIPSLDYIRNIPKKAEGFIVITKDGTDVKVLNK